jgi:peroxiredoxin
MPNAYLTSTLIAKQAAIEYKLNNNYLKLAKTDYDGMFTEKTYKPGDTVKVRLRNRFITQRGDTVTSQDLEEKSRDLTILPLFSVPFTYTPTDLTRKIADFSEEILQPAVDSLTAQICLTVSQYADQQLWRTVGTAGTAINSFAASNAANTELTKAATPMGDWYQALSIEDADSLSNSLQNSFNVGLNTEITKSAMIGHLGAFDIWREHTIFDHETFVGAIGTPIVNGSVADGAATIVASGFTASQTGILKAGDIVTFSGVYDINPLSYQSYTPKLAQFVVDADVNSDGAGAVTFVVRNPAVYVTTKATQTVSGQILNGATINVVGQTNGGYKTNIAFRKKALILVNPRLDKMDSPESAVYTSNGISMRISKTAEVLNNKNVMRLDTQIALLWNGENACKLIS